MKKKKAIIFDMDGVIIDSEKFWKQAEYEVFSSLGVKITLKDSEKTKAMTTTEVAEFWYRKYPWKNITLNEVEQMVISRVIDLIKTEDCQINGIKSFIEMVKSYEYKIGLATNSPKRIIPVVLKKLKIYHLFDITLSAESLQRGKPDPMIYLKVAEKLKIMPGDCIVIEDSHTGMLAAKNAGMTVIAFTNGNEKIDSEIADYRLETFDKEIIVIL